jgi:hypothetical protein
MAMKSRCLNPADKNYRRYGARGITVCERWLMFDNFLSDMGTRPSLEYTLGRQNNDGNYEPGNVKWEVDGEQRSNTSKTRLVRVNGEYITVTECARQNNLPTSTLCRRLDSGCTVEDAITRPLQQGKKLIS